MTIPRDRLIAALEDFCLMVPETPELNCEEPGVVMMQIARHDEAWCFCYYGFAVCRYPDIASAVARDTSIVEGVHNVFRPIMDRYL